MILDDEDCAIVEKMLRWPTSHIFPALDAARLVIAVPSGGSYFFGKRNGEILSDVLRHLSSTEATAAVLIMGCRFLCNLFGNRVVKSAMMTHVDDVLKSAFPASRSDNRRARETFASLLINYSLMMYENKASVAERAGVLNCAIQLISSGERDEEVLYRLAVAMGTVMCGDEYTAKRGVELGAAQAAADVASVSPRLQQVATEIATLIVC